MGTSGVLNYKRLRKRDVLRNAKEIGFRPGTIIDVGFAYGTQGLDEVFEDARYVLVDPMSEIEQVMQRFCEAHPGSLYFVAAASDQEGEMEFIAREGVTGSSFHTKLKADGVKRKVPLVTLDRILAQNDLPDPLLIKLDTEGHELHVLRGGEAALARAGMVIVEISTWMEENSLGRPSLMEVFTFMDQRGFVFYEFAEPAFRPIDGALYMFDAVFVPRDSPLRRHRGSKSPEQARISREVKRRHAEVGILPKPAKAPRNLWERMFGRRG